MENLRQSGEQLIQAVAYGDAAGLPVETKSRLEISFEHGWLNRLIAAKDNPFFAGEHEPGTWSDDTQLTIAVAEALVTADGFDLDTMAEAHIKAYFETPQVDWRGKLVPRGWGGSSIRSIKRLISGGSPLFSGVSGTNAKGESLGAGNGILMKMAPLVFWQVARDTEVEQRYDEYDKLTRMTHNTDIAAVCTRVHGDVLHYLLKSTDDESQLVDSFPDYVVERATEHERSLKLEGDELSRALRYLALPDTGAGHTPEDILANTDGKGFYAPQTLAMAYGAFYFLADDFYHTVYQAVNLGGDTDSIGSIVAAMIDFVSGGDIDFPEDVSLLKDREQLHKVSHKLTQAALRK